MHVHSGFKKPRQKGGYYIYFEHMVNRIYPAEHQLNKVNSSDTEAPFLDFN